MKEEKIGCFTAVLSIIAAGFLLPIILAVVEICFELWWPGVADLTVLKRIIGIIKSCG